MIKIMMIIMVLSSEHEVMSRKEVDVSQHGTLQQCREYAKARSAPVGDDGFLLILCEQQKEI